MRAIHSSKSREAFGVVVTFTANNLSQAIFPSYLPIEFLPADAWPFFTRANTFFDGLLFFCPRQFRIQQLAELFFSSLVSFGSSSSILSKLIGFNRILSGNETRGLFLHCVALLQFTAAYVVLPMF